MLYQSGSQRIEVIVRKEVSGGEFPQGTKEVDSDQMSSENEIANTSNSIISKKFIKINATHGLAVAKQGFDAGLQYYIHGIAINNGDTALQQQTQRVYEIYKTASGFASSIAMGATYGSMGGPIGIALGVTFGAISNTISIMTRRAEEFRDFNFKLFKENNSIEYQRARASINLTTGRLR